MRRPDHNSAITILALGDSLTAGYGVARGAALPDVLERMLADEGFNVRIVNAGLNGDTASGGLSRLPWLLEEPLDAAIVEFGINDAFIGLDPGAVRAALEAIIERLKDHGAEVMLVGARVLAAHGEEYAANFEGVYEDLANRHGLILHPFVLEGAFGDRNNLQWDGLHPNEQGVENMAARMLPGVRELVERVHARRRDGRA